VAFFERAGAELRGMLEEVMGTVDLFSNAAWPDLCDAAAAASMQDLRSVLEEDKYNNVSLLAVSRLAATHALNTLMGLTNLSLMTGEPVDEPAAPKTVLGLTPGALVTVRKNQGRHSRTVGIAVRRETTEERTRRGAGPADAVTGEAQRGKKKKKTGKGKPSVVSGTNEEMWLVRSTDIGACREALKREDALEGTSSSGATSSGVGGGGGGGGMGMGNVLGVGGVGGSGGKGLGGVGGARLSPSPSSIPGRSSILKGVERVIMVVGKCVRFHHIYPSTRPAPPPPPPTHPACERRDLPNAKAKRDCLVPVWWARWAAVGAVGEGGDALTHACVGAVVPTPSSYSLSRPSWSHAQFICARLHYTA
jgi:hypothetical protein